jgi:hypothetical protein
MKVLIGTILTILALSIFGAVIVKSITLEQNCTGYLKRAADANTVETASVQLERAINYLEENNLTTGYTSVLWRTPDEDIEFWFNNLKESQNELSKVDDTTSSLEKSNILMKLRETLMDNGQNGDKLTVPLGLSRFPNNALWGLLMWLGGLLFPFLMLWTIYEVENS